MPEGLSWLEWDGLMHGMVTLDPLTNRDGIRSCRVWYLDSYSHRVNISVSLPLPCSQYKDGGEFLSSSCGENLSFPSSSLWRKFIRLFFLKKYKIFIRYHVYVCVYII